MKRIFYLAFCVLALACSKSGGSDPEPTPPDPDSKPDPENKAPSVPDLVYPEKDQLCLEAELTFNWSAAVDPEGDALTYQIQISTNRSFSAMVEDQVVEGSLLDLVLEKGNDYYWRVLAIDAKGNKGEFSPSYAFYVEGEADTNYIPFIPALNSPKQNSEVAAVNVQLSWEASDLDDNTLVYDIYLGANENPGLFQAGINESTLEVDLEPNSTYYWQVYVSDGKAISVGDVWTFRTN